MAISVNVPKNFSGIKTKVALNLTKRQLICFGSAALTGVPTYFLSRPFVGQSVAALLMVAVALPFFFFSMYERDGFPAEQLLYQMIRQQFLVPGIRPYQTESIYQSLADFETLRKEAEHLEAKAKGTAQEAEAQ